MSASHHWPSSRIAFYLDLSGWLFDPDQHPLQQMRELVRSRARRLVRAVDESTMRASAYNLCVRDREDRYCLFNTRRGTARLPDQQEYLSYWSEVSGEPSLNDAGDLVMQLADDGFLVENDTNELADIEAEHLEARLSREKVSLIIAPTMACNLDCSYCFETNRYAGRMSDQTLSQLVGLVRHHFETGMKRLAVTWYGGEPLLALGAIERLSGHFLALCEEFSGEYSASIVH